MDSGQWTVDCGLRAAGCGLRAAGCGLRAAGCALGEGSFPKSMVFFILLALQSYDLILLYRKFFQVGIP